jgi:triacylglycerol lipase
MNGRLQRAWCLLRLGVAFGVGWHVGWAWGLLTLAAPAAVLALGFLQLRWVNTGPLRPGWGELLRAWAGEVVASERAFAWQQPWREHAWPDHLPDPLHEGATQGVLLLHGFACNRGRWNGWLARLRAQGVAVVAPTLEPAFGSIDAYADAVEAAVQRLQAHTGRMPVIVAHSMGGLVARAWWRAHAGERPAVQVITLGTPHGGTRMARFSPTANARQMRRQGAWLGALPGLAELDCCWTRCDQVVNPADTACLPGARHHEVRAVGHMGLVYSPVAWGLLQSALASSRVSASTPRRI